MESTIGYESFGELKTANGFDSYFARKKGRSHIASGTPCQDYCLVKNIGSNVQVVAIADGHGGIEYEKSDIGSKIACELLYALACETCKSGQSSSDDYGWIDYFTTSEFKHVFINMWKSKVLQNYKNYEEPYGKSDGSIVKKYGTTLIFAIFSDLKIVIGQLGDGAVLLFDQYYHYQLFKRHSEKMGSSTNSLVSGRAEYAFITECYDRKSFPYILLSTDGIYDKLDTSDAFFTYGRYLVNQLEETGLIEAPFNVDEEIDVSEISKDDCTVVLVNNEKAVSYSHIFENTLKPYAETEFYRRMDGLEIYNVIYEGKPYVLHIVERTSDMSLESVEMTPVLSVIEPVYRKQIGTKMLYIYPDNKGNSSVKELIEKGKHLEKRYSFNNTEIEIEDNREALEIDSNVYWMNVYEQLSKLKKNLAEAGISLRPHAFESAFISKDGKIIFFEDALEKKTAANHNILSPIERLQEYFSIIGKLRCGNTEIPLFKCSFQGQNIDMLHCLRDKKSLGRVIYNQEKKMYGLWNTSRIAWTLVEENKQSIPPQGVLRLNKNHTMLLSCEDIEDLADNIVVKDGYVKYEIISFQEKSC